MDYKVLAADDHPTVRMLTEQAIRLETKGTKQEKSAINAKDAFDRWVTALEKEEPFHLLITDNSMPPGKLGPKGEYLEADHGLALIKAIREYEEAKGIKKENRVSIIISSGDDLDAQMLKEKFGAHFIKKGGKNDKPDIKELREKIRENNNEFKLKQELEVNEAVESKSDITPILKRQHSNPAANLPVDKRIRPSLPTPPDTPGSEISEAEAFSHAVGVTAEAPSKRPIEKIPQGVSELEHFKIVDKLGHDNYEIQAAPTHGFNGKFGLDGDGDSKLIAQDYRQKREDSKVIIYRVSGSRVQYEGKEIKVNKAASQGSGLKIG